VESGEGVFLGSLSLAFYYARRLINIRVAVKHYPSFYHCQAVMFDTVDVCTCLLIKYSNASWLMFAAICYFVLYLCGRKVS
jgi:hypothetical protein